MTWIQTLTGKKFNLLDPQQDSIDPQELAVILSRICRFGGHCHTFYSVAQHSVIVSDLISETQDPDLRLAALLHDAHEAYSGFGDVCRPAKHLNSDAERFLSLHTERIDIAIADRFGIQPIFHHSRIRFADNVALATESRDLMLPPPEPWCSLPQPLNEKIKPLSIRASEKLFLKRLKKLWKE